MNSATSAASIGSLIRRKTFICGPKCCGPVASHPGLDIDQLGAVDVLEEDTTLGEIVLPVAADAALSRLHSRFRRTAPLTMQQETRMLLVAPNQGEVERLANLLREYELPYRLGSRIQHAGSENIYDESSYLAGNFARQS